MDDGAEVGRVTDREIERGTEKEMEKELGLQREGE